MEHIKCNNNMISGRCFIAQEYEHDGLQVFFYKFSYILRFLKVSF